MRAILLDEKETEIISIKWKEKTQQIRKLKVKFVVSMFSGWVHWSYPAPLYRSPVLHCYYHPFPPLHDPGKLKVHIVIPLLLTVGHLNTGHCNMPILLFLFGLQWLQDKKNKHTHAIFLRNNREKNLQKCHQTLKIYLISRAKGAEQREGEEKRSGRKRDVSNSSSLLVQTGNLGAASCSIMYWFS